MNELLATLQTPLDAISGWHLAALALACWCVGALTLWPWARALAVGAWSAGLCLALWAPPTALVLGAGALLALLAYSGFAYRVAGAWPVNRTRRWPRLARRYRGAQASVLYRTEPGRGWVQLGERLWPVHCNREITPGQLVMITGRRGRVLTCERADAPSPAATQHRTHRTGK